MKQSENKILCFSKSLTLKKIIEYSLDGCIATVEHGTEKFLKGDLSGDYSLIIFDGNLLASSHANAWEKFLHQVHSPLIILDCAMDKKPAIMTSSTNRRLILQKPFDREKFFQSTKSLGLSLFEKEKEEARKSEAFFDPTQPLPNQVQELLRKEALAFVSDYCKSHFRPIAEEILLKEIRRLTEERNSFLEEG